MPRAIAYDLMIYYNNAACSCFELSRFQILVQLNCPWATLITEEKWLQRNTLRKKSTNRIKWPLPWSIAKWFFSTAFENNLNTISYFATLFFRYISPLIGLVWDLSNKQLSIINLFDVYKTTFIAYVLRFVAAVLNY